MRLRTFTAQTMAEAMRKLREELGKDAILVSSKTDRAGVRLVAAVDDAISEEERFPSFDASASPDHQPGDPTEQIHEALIGHGLPPLLLERLLDAAFQAGIDDPRTALALALNSVFRFQPLADRGGSRPIMLIGAPGVGKTVTTAKLAARARFAGAAVRVITTDTVRAGGIEQLDAFTRLMKLPLETADSPARLAQVVGTVAPGERVLIDTAGVNPYSPHDLRELAAFAEAISAEPVLVMAAGGDALDAVEQTAAFHPLGVNRFIVTRLDVVRRLGSVFAAADAARFSFAEISATSAVADGLLSVDAAALAGWLMPISAADLVPELVPQLVQQGSTPSLPRKSAITGHRP
jgi:flagellar biosynthesis protein FlhF